MQQSELAPQQEMEVGGLLTRIQDCSREILIVMRAFAPTAASVCAPSIEASLLRESLQGAVEVLARLRCVPGAPQSTSLKRLKPT